MFRLRIKRVGILLPLLALWGCGAGESLGVAKAGVARVHQQMNAEQFADIYAQAAPPFRNATASQDFLDFMSAIHRKLGKVQDATQTSFFVNYTTSGLQVRVNYKTKFESGEAQEEFLWVVSGKQAALLGYHINSTALIIK